MSQRPTVLTGALGLLASAVAAHCLVRDDEPVVCLCAPETFAALTPFVRSAAGRVAADADTARLDARIATRLSLGTPADLPPDAEVWHFAAAPARVDPALLSWLRTCGVTTLNEVITPYAGGGHAKWITGSPSARPGAASGDRPSSPETARMLDVHRVFTTPLVVAPETPIGAAREGLLHVAGVCLDVVSEVEARLPRYFDHFALRCAGDADATISVVDADDAARWMLEVAAHQASGDYRVPPTYRASYADFLELLGESSGISMLAEPDAGELNAIDQALTARLQGLDAWLAPPGAHEGSSADAREKLLETLNAIRDAYRRSRETFNGRVADLSAALEMRETTRAGHPLVYATAGSGSSAIVLLNAFGQGVAYWLPLIEVLRTRYRIVTWDLRGVTTPPEPSRLSDHVEDLEAILASEGIRDCYVIAWCTGPKIAVEYALRHPDAVRGLVFLNATLRCFGIAPELETEYERNFEVICRALDERPAMADSVMRSLAASATGGEVGMPGTDSELDQVPATLVQTMSAELKDDVLRPLSDARRVVNYVRQLLDFWGADIRERAPLVRGPVLLLSCEHDRIAPPAASETGATLFPAARHARVPGASHYFLHDRPDAVAEMIDAFIADTGGAGAPPASRRQAGQAALG